MLLPVITPLNVPIPVVEPAETNGYWTVTISSISLTAITWCIADVSPHETLTSDLTLLSIVLSIVENVNPIPEGPVT